MKVYAIIPAHNEGEGIEKALVSIIKQTHKIEKIIVACDNCSDGTEEICKKLSTKHPNLFYFSTVNNSKRKAGALNQAFSKIKEERWDLLLQMDADSILQENLIEEGIKEFLENPNLGGICSRFRIGDYIDGSFLLYTLQYLEYSFFDSIQVEKRMNTHVLSGTASLLRRRALVSLKKSRIWDEKSIVEDYALTLELKKKGWKTKVGKNMHITTDYMRTWKNLWKQRRRWIYGTAEELKKRGWNRHTCNDILTQGYNLLFGFFEILFIIVLLFLVIPDQTTEWHPVGTAVLIVMLANKMYRCKYIKRKTFFNLFVANYLIPEYFYRIFLIFCMFSCHLRLVFKIRPKWN